MNDAPDMAVIARLKAKPGGRTAMLDALRALTAAVADEAGTIMYVFHEDLADSDVVWAYELYRDQAAFDAHGKNPALGEAVGSLAPHVAEAPALHQVRPLFGKGLS